MAVEAKEGFWWSGLNQLLLRSGLRFGRRTQPSAAHGGRWNCSGKEVTFSTLFCVTPKSHR